MTLEQLLMNLLDDDIKKYEGLTNSAQDPTFSAKHYATVRNAIRMTETYEKKESAHGKLRHIKTRYFAVAILIAVLVMVSSVMAFAIVHPEYYMVIKEKIREWSITFEMDSEDESISKFEVRKGDAPDGFSISNEIIEEGIYMVEYTSLEGKQILYKQQQLSDATVVGLDAENDYKKIEIINGIKTIVMKKKDCYTFFWVKDNCIYTLVGNCELKIMNQYRESIN